MLHTLRQDICRKAPTLDEWKKNALVSCIHYSKCWLHEQSTKDSLLLIKLYDKRNDTLLTIPAQHHRTHTHTRARKCVCKLAAFELLWKLWFCHWRYLFVNCSRCDLKRCAVARARIQSKSSRRIKRDNAIHQFIDVYYVLLSRSLDVFDFSRAQHSQNTIKYANNVR